jgi:ABC-type lipoprotein release transport system permease subunit
MNPSAIVMNSSYLPVLKVLLYGRSAFKILLATVFSFTFSIAVILCTFGLMDGFDHLLKSGLRHSSGDLLVTSRSGFFKFDPSLESTLKELSPISIAPLIQTEAFIIGNGVSKGVIVRGIEEENFSAATGLKLNLTRSGIIIGDELARSLRVRTGDEIALTLGKGHESASALPSVRTFKVSGIVKHGIYQKDLRFIYLSRKDLSQLLQLGDRINFLILTFQDPNIPLESLDVIQKYQQLLRGKLATSYLVRPFWSEYSYLIEAVKVEKFSISLILQLIVVVAVFNIMAFVIFIMEKKAQEFFFLRAIGLSLKSLMRIWFTSILIIWSVSCVGAHLLSKLFNWGLSHLSFLQIPGEIYVLSSLQIKLNSSAYLTVYLLSLLWIILAGVFGYWRLKRQTIVQGLRQEFSA